MVDERVLGGIVVLVLAERPLVDDGIVASVLEERGLRESWVSPMHARFAMHVATDGMRWDCMMLLWEQARVCLLADLLALRVFGEVEKHRPQQLANSATTHSDERFDDEPLCMSISGTLPCTETADRQAS